METHLKQILDTMNIPNQRKELNLNNLHWLNRNIFIHNNSHPRLKEAQKLIQNLLKNK